MIEIDDGLGQVATVTERPGFVPQAASESLRRGWNASESATRAPVRQSSLDDWNDELDPLTISRWEDDGGYVPRGAWSA